MFRIFIHFSKDGKIIGRGYNIGFAQPLRNRYSIHAEVSAIFNTLKAKHKIKGADLYVVQLFEDNSGERLRCSKPCMNCKSVIEKHGIKNVYYSMPEVDSVILKRIQ